MKNAIALFTAFSFLLATLTPYFIPLSEAAITIGAKDETLPEMGRVPHFVNLDRRNQLERNANPQKPASISEPRPQLKSSDKIKMDITPFAPTEQTNKKEKQDLFTWLKETDPLVARVLEDLVKFADTLSQLKSMGVNVATLNVGALASFIAGKGTSESGSGQAEKSSSTIVAANSSSGTPVGNGEGDPDPGPVVGPGGNWSYTRGVVSKGEFTLQYLTKLIQWVVDFMKELNREQSGRHHRELPTISVEE